MLNLSGLEDVQVGLLSAGQRKKVSLLKLYYSNSLFWILDEPFAALDSKTVSLLEHKFIDHVKRGGAILFTSHQMIHFNPYYSDLYFVKNTIPNYHSAIKA